MIFCLQYLICARAVLLIFQFNDLIQIKSSRAAWISHTSTYSHSKSTSSLGMSVRTNKISCEEKFGAIEDLVSSISSL